MMRFCLMDPRPFSWDRLIWMNRQWKGVVFVDFRDEKAPNFILNLTEELQREGIAESIAPCQTFAKSFMMVSPATKRKDLVLLLRPMDEDIMSRLEQWRTNNQGEQVIMLLSEYVKQYWAEFTGIGQPAKANESNDSGGKAEEKDTSKKKSKKDRRKSNQPAATPEPSEPSDEVNNDAGNEPIPEESTTTNEGSEVPNEAEGNQ